MPCLQLNFFVLICIYLAAFAHISLQTKDETRSVKKDLNIVATSEAHLLGQRNGSQTMNLTSDAKSQYDNSITKMKARNFQKNLDIEIPESFKMGFYFFIGLSAAAILFILVKTYRMRLSRAERKYRVHGDRTTQELTPLPMAIEGDSDNDDHTLFEINRQIRVS